MLASFLTHILWHPWQAGAHHLAWLFLDYEPGIHNIGVYIPVVNSRKHYKNNDYFYNDYKNNGLAPSGCPRAVRIGANFHFYPIFNTKNMPTFQEKLKGLGPGSVAVAGIPFDEYSSYLRGAAEAPEKIWEAFYSDSANTYAEDGTDIKDHPQVINMGALPFVRYQDISDSAGRILATGARLLSLGGDHSIAYPVIKAHARYHQQLTILQLDAHSDLYDEFEGNRYSHACPFARIMEEGLARRLVQVGIRTLTAQQRQQAERFGVEVHEMRFGLPRQLKLNGPLYLSLDMDVLDPAFAPGISHHEPGGLSTREVLNIIHAIDVPIIGADIVELNPQRDINGMTAMVAAKFFREILARMVRK
ncbi:MAG: agmatinase [Phaeodactylibacter sp.]|nr:agmatinase [Phaeodactylibacter sp.]MCB9049669.1 agmatinase [Lewinellaceae bacterium]